MEKKPVVVIVRHAKRTGMDECEAGKEGGLESLIHLGQLVAREYLLGGGSSVEVVSSDDTVAMRSKAAVELGLRSVSGIPRQYRQAITGRVIPGLFEMKGDGCLNPQQTFDLLVASDVDVRVFVAHYPHTGWMLTKSLFAPQYGLDRPRALPQYLNHGQALIFSPDAEEGTFALVEPDAELIWFAQDGRFPV